MDGLSVSDSTAMFCLGFMFCLLCVGVYNVIYQEPPDTD